MNPKATQELAQLPDGKFMPAISAGLQYVIENVKKLSSNAKVLCEAEEYRDGRILKALAEEEGAKILILLDAVRCPRSSGPERANLARHLRAFNDHLAKGIYAEACSWRPAKFS